MRERTTEIIAGLAVFFSMSYVAFAVPLLLGSEQGAGMPALPVFFATCLMAAAASFASGYYGRAPASLASGIALSAAIAQFLRYEETTITWESALVVCFVAGVCLLLASVSGFRLKVLESIPQSIKLATIGGIGALLAETAVRLVREHPGAFTHNLRLFLAGIGVIVLGYVVLRSIAERVKATAPRAGRWLDLIGRASLPVSVVLVAYLAYTPQQESLGAAAGIDMGQALWPWASTEKTVAEIVNGALEWESVLLLFFMLYILFADIVGSPYHMALDENRYDSSVFTAGEKTGIRRSFLVDSIANMAAPIAGTSPVVYYAENFAGRVAGGRTPLVAYIPAIGFLLLLIAGLILYAQGESLSVLIPKLAVAPVLFFVGIMIIAKALWPASEGGRGAADDDAEARPADENLRELSNLRRQLPAAISIVATPMAGFDIGVAAGILSYFLLSFLVPRPEGAAREPGSEGALVWLAVVAAVSLFIRVKLGFG